MLNEELNDSFIQTKLNYLNGYLDALAYINSYPPVCMNYKLFQFNFSAGNIERAIQNNAYELFGVYPDEWELELIKEDHWIEKLKNELYRQIPDDLVHSKNLHDSHKHDLIRRLVNGAREASDHFIHLLNDEFGKKSDCIYELKITKGDFYKLLGIDLVFEIEDTKIIFLQLNGSD